MLDCMVDGRMDEMHDVEHRPRIELPYIPERIVEPTDDTAGAPMLPPNEIEGQSGETTFRSKDRASAEDVRVQRTKNELRGPESLSVQPAVLAATRDALNIQLRDLRVARKHADGMFVRFSKSGRDRLAAFDRDIEETRRQRDMLDMEMEAMLPNQAKSVPRADVVAEARQRIGETLAPALAGKMERPRKAVLHAERIRLINEASKLSFWQFGRKREVAAAIREIDREMSGILNKEKGL